MISDKYIFLAVLTLLPLAGEATDNPFNANRMLSEVKQGDTLVLPKKKVNVLCGIRQSFDAITFCVDGAWLDLTSIEFALGVKLKWVKYSSVSFGRDVYLIGDQMRFHKSLKSN